MSSESSPVKAGLEGLVVGEQGLSTIDGEKGELRYRGYAIEDLVEHSSFEEVCWLLWRGELPTAAELRGFQAELLEHRTLPPEAGFLIHGLATRADPMTALRTIVSALATNDAAAANSSDPEVAAHAGTRLLAQLPTAVAAYHRIRAGEPIIPPDDELDAAANFLWMLHGKRPSEAEDRIFDGCLILHAEHGFNASTFAARCTASTLSDIYSAITTAVGTLKGPLHGGANTAVMETLLEIGEVDQVEPWLEKALGEKRKIMGFGHRVYQVDDPRGTLLRRYSREMGQLTGEPKWYELSEALAAAVRKRKPLIINVDFYSASTYHSLDIPPDLYTALFALARLPGWVAHILDQYRNNRLIRPKATYNGPPPRDYVELENRGT